MALTESKARVYAPAAYQFDNFGLPVKAAAVIHAGAALEWNGGYLEPASGAGTFAGFALESSAAVAGESDGDRTITVRQAGAVELDITTDTVLAADLGNDAVTIEATDDDTFRREPGSAITGQTIGKVIQIITAGAAGRVLVSFKASMLA